MSPDYLAERGCETKAARIFGHPPPTTAAKTKLQHGPCLGSGNMTDPGEGTTMARMTAMTTTMQDRPQEMQSKKILPHRSTVSSDD